MSAKLPTIALLFVLVLSAAEHKGEVKFGGLSVPGATVTAIQGDRSLVAITSPPRRNLRFRPRTTLSTCQLTGGRGCTVIHCEGLHKFSYDRCGYENSS